MLDLKRLHILQELSHRGTLGETAAALGLTPSAVSQHLAILEKECGRPLLERRGRNVVLTRAARIMVEHAGRILHEMDLAQTALEVDDGSAAGIVRLAIFQTAAMALLPSALRILAERFPAVTVQVVQHEPESAFAAASARDTDLVVAEQYPHRVLREYPELDSRRLAEDPVMLVLPADSTVRRLDEAADLPWVLEPEPNASREWALQVGRRAGFEPRIRYEFDDVRTHLDLVRAGLAAAVLPGFAWSGREAGLKLLDLQGRPHRHVFTSARRDMASRPAIEAVRSALEEAALRVRGG